MLTADNFEDLELLVPYYRLKEAGVEVDVASMSKGKVTGKHGLSIEANLSFREVRAGLYEVLVLPGGRAPERVRLDEQALAIARFFMEKNKVVAAICHGPQILISAGMLQGRKLTGWRGIQDDIKLAGAQVEDVEVVVDDNLVTSRQPEDLPAFTRELMKKIKT